MSLPLEKNASEKSNRWPSYQPMVLVVVAFAAGVLFDRVFNLDWRVTFAIAWISLIGSYVYQWLLNEPPNRLTRLTGRQRMASTVILIGLFCAGAFWHHGRWNWFSVNEIGLFARNVSTSCCVDATVISEPHWVVVDQNTDDGGMADSARTRFAVRVNRIRDGRNWVKATGVADLVIHTTTRHVKSGDTIRIFGRLVAGTPPSNPGQFDFQEFYRAKSKLAFLHAYENESVVVLSRSKRFGSQLLSTLRQRLNEITWQYVGNQEAGFASAILLGNREQLSRPRRDSFLQTGTVHLLAISGLHVGILAGSFFLLFRIGLVSRRRCLLITILFVIFYAWLVEFRPPVSRAAILIILFCLGRLWGERNFSFNLLAIAGLIVLLINPSDLFGLGPQLSFLAVATLTFGREWVFSQPSRDPIKRLIAGTRPWHVRCFNWMGRQTKAAFLVSGLIWIVAMPLVAFRFHLIAPIALIVNPLLLIPIAWALYGGMGVLTFGWFLTPIANVCGWFCERNLGVIESMIHVAQSIPFSHIWTCGPPVWSLSIFYAGVLLFAVYPPTRLSGRCLVYLAGGWLVFGWFVPDQVNNYIDRNFESPLVCTFIDVGHGSSVLIQSPDGKNILYDAGSFGSAEYGARSIAGALWSERIKHLDAVILSHADVDHFNALPFLVEQFSVEVVYVSRQMQQSDSSAVLETFKSLKRHNIRIELVAAGDQLFKDSKMNLEIIGPPVSGHQGNDNANSVVAIVEYLGKKVLLPGDLERTGLEHLFASTPIDFDLVMAAHHGSKNSQPEKFMSWATPEYVVISGGSQRVSTKTVKKFAAPNREVARTDLEGAIRFTVESTGMKLERWNSNPWQ